MTSEGNNKMMKKEVIAQRMAIISIFKVDLDIGCMGHYRFWKRVDIKKGATLCSNLVNLKI